MKPGTRKLSEVTKHLVLPSDIASTGYPSVAAQCRKMGVEHDDWQQGMGRAMLGKRIDGRYAAGVGGVLISICRQVGKTFTIGTIIFALCILFPGIKVLWTAHHSKTTDELFETLEALTRRPKIAAYIAKVTGGNGKQAIRFTNGSRILFGAREHGFGRGIPGVSIVVFDEAQILTAKALDDMIASTNTAKNPLIVYMGTPPKPSDPAEVFKARRRKALAVEAKRAAGEVVENHTLYIEVGADDGADPDDREQWAKGNPSYPDRTDEEAIMRLREQLADDASFLREGMGIWDSDQAGSRLIPAKLWKERAIAAAPEGVISYGVAFSQDGTRVALSGARKHDRTRVHCELIDAVSGSIDDGIDALADWLAACWQDTAQIVISGAAGATVLEQKLRERKVPAKVIWLLTTTKYLTACSLTWEAVKDGTFTHLDDPGQKVLDNSVGIADQKKRNASGGWGWEATTPDGDETPIESVSCALYGARMSKRVPGRKQVIL